MTLTRLKELTRRRRFGWSLLATAIVLMCGLAVLTRAQQQPPSHPASDAGTLDPAEAGKAFPKRPVLAVCGPELPDASVLR